MQYKHFVLDVRLTLSFLVDFPIHLFFLYPKNSIKLRIYLIMTVSILSNYADPDKCHRMRHFIGVSTVCQRPKHENGKLYNKCPYIFHQNKILEKRFSKFSMPTNIIMLNYYVWYRFTYTEQKWKRYITIIYILWESIGQKVLTKA